MRRKLSKWKMESKATTPPSISFMFVVVNPGKKILYPHLQIDMNMCIYMYVCMCVCVFDARWGATADQYVIKNYRMYIVYVQ